VSTPDRSGADQIDAEHQATDLVVRVRCTLDQGFVGGLYFGQRSVPKRASRVASTRADGSLRPNRVPSEW
jgi:hypothetical protein